MPKRTIYDPEGNAHFVTFSCYKRRRLLDEDAAKQVVLAILQDQLNKQNAKCAGFVIMPDHVHAIVWFPQAGQISHFMKQWKQRSSVRIKRLFRDRFIHYAATVRSDDPVWQPHYYSFNIVTEKKLREKLNYIHANPVREGFVKNCADWLFSSARYYERAIPVGIPLDPLI